MPQETRRGLGELRILRYVADGTDPEFGADGFRLKSIGRRVWKNKTLERRGSGVFVFLCGDMGDWAERPQV